MLRDRFGAAYLPSPWIRFADATGQHWCQPDGLLSVNGRIVIVEFKYQHTVDAWHQLRQLYEPVISVLHPGVCTSVVEIVKWYDCALAFPEPVKLVKDVAAHLSKDFGVHIWKP